MPIEWPHIGEELCHHFSICVLIGDYNPAQLQMKLEPSTEHRLKTAAPGPESDTFVLVRQMFHNEEPSQLIVEVGRRGWFDGKEPQPDDLTSLQGLLRRMDPFYGKQCTSNAQGDYFTSKDEDMPNPIKVAIGPFGSGTPTFKSQNGLFHVENGPAQQIAWYHRPDGLCRIVIASWFKGIFAPDVVTGIMSDFHSLFRTFRNAEVQSD